MLLSELVQRESTVMCFVVFILDRFPFNIQTNTSSERQAQRCTEVEYGTQADLQKHVLAAFGYDCMVVCSHMGGDSKYGC